jgi:hypothetical protein
MMSQTTKTAEEINEMVNVYFKQIDKNESVNWDDFDDILQQVIQFVMEHQERMDNFVERHDDVRRHFERRASRQEFPSMKYLIYLNFACVVQLDGILIDKLLRYGTDEIYPRLHWPDKLQILDTVNRANVPYKNQVFSKICIDVMLAGYTDLVFDMNLEGIIQMIAHIKTISADQSSKSQGRVELWQKL